MSFAQLDTRNAENEICCADLGNRNCGLWGLLCSSAYEELQSVTFVVLNYTSELQGMRYVMIN